MERKKVTRRDIKAKLRKRSRTSTPRCTAQIGHSDFGKIDRSREKKEGKIDKMVSVCDAMKTGDSGDYTTNDEIYGCKASKSSRMGM